MSVPELEPTAEEITQVETVPLSAIPVTVEGPVRVQNLPRKSAAGRTMLIGTTAVRVLHADPHRAKAVLMGISATPATILIGFTRFAFGTDTTAVVTWPTGQPFTIEAVTEVWVASDGTSTGLTMYRENWAQG